jgi:thiol-disulfide isomerase/thioredoxin
VFVESISLLLAPWRLKPRPQRRRWRRVFGLAALGLLFGAGGAQADSRPALDLAAYKGKVVYLDFWASWCGPCRLSFPYMERLSQYYARQPFVIVAVNLDHSRDKADAFLAQFGPDIHVVYDPTGQIATKYGVKAMPTSVLIGRDGRIRYVHDGFFAEKLLVYESHISELLNEK